MPPSSTNLITHSDLSAAQFLAHMEPLLLAHEERYGLMLGIALNVLRKPDFYSKEPAYFVVVEDGEGVAAAGCMTPPHGIIVYSERADPGPGLRAVAEDVRRRGLSLPTGMGPEPICTDFAAIWSEVAGVKSEVGVRERTFALHQVIHPTYSAGHMRPARLDDLELLAQWFVAFTVEALHGIDNATLDEARERLRMRIEQGWIFVWEDGEVVSYAGVGRPTPNGISIGPVYTPPEFRGKGYASSCVAAVSQRMLNEGRAFCTLFTDLANPTSNHIYQAIGYKPVCDYTLYRFST